MKFTCEKTAQGLRLKIGPHEGTYPAWWKEIHVELYGLLPRQAKLSVIETKVSSLLRQSEHGVEFQIVDTAKGAEVELK
jgi:alpha-glucosidase